jgi:hypothetical protein
MDVVKEGSTFTPFANPCPPVMRTRRQNKDELVRTGLRFGIIGNLYSSMFPVVQKIPCRMAVLQVISSYSGSLPHVIIEMPYILIQLPVDIKPGIDCRQVLFCYMIFFRPRNPPVLLDLSLLFLPIFCAPPANPILATPRYWRKVS